MNKVTCKNHNPIYTTYIPGDLFVDREASIYILSKIGIVHREKYVCVSLSSGGNWDSLKDNIPDAVNGLKFWCRGAEIEVTAPKD